MDGKNSDNGINQSNSVIGIKLLRAQSDPIKRRPLYIKGNVPDSKKKKQQQLTNESNFLAGNFLGIIF